MVGNAANPARPRFAPKDGFDLLNALGSFLATPPPLTLLIMGAPGTGKSTLLQSLIPLVRAPPLFVAYRAETADPARSIFTDSGDAVLSLFIVDPETESPEGPRDRGSEPGHSVSFAPVAAQSGAGVPATLSDAGARLATAGGGCVFVDSWDPASEAMFLTHGGGREHASTVEVQLGVLRKALGRLRIRMVLVATGDPGSELLSMADGIVDLGWETADGFSLRVASVPKLQRIPVPQPRYLFALDRGAFYCPPQHAPGFHPPVGPPDADPSPVVGMIFPGSQAFVDAFGRLRVHGITGLGISPHIPSNLADVFLIPMVAHTLKSGGRVVWFPPLASGPSQICAQLAPFVPADFIRERLRIVTAGTGDPGLGDLRTVALPVRRESGETRGVRSSTSSPTAPIFPDAYDFLLRNPADRTSLVGISLDGFKALAAVAGIALDPATFFLRISAYQRLSGRHAVSFGAASDPLMQAMMPIMDSYIRIEEKYGRTVLLGERPRTSPYILDWTDPSGGYKLVPVR